MPVDTSLARYLRLPGVLMQDVRRFASEPPDVSEPLSQTFLFAILMLALSIRLRLKLYRLFTQIISEPAKFYSCWSPHFKYAVPAYRLSFYSKYLDAIDRLARKNNPRYFKAG